MSLGAARGAGAGTTAVRVLELDPGLGDALDGRRFQAAQREVVAPSARLRASRAVLEPDVRRARPVPILVASGVLLRELAIDGRRRAELLGPGDVVRPRAAQLAADLAGRLSLSWRALEPGRLVFLDQHFLRSAGPWPEITAAVIDRALVRAQALAAQVALSSLPRVEDRLGLLFRQLAEKWGCMTADGVRVRLPLTHELLGELVGAQRPTVTSALGRLGDRGSLIRGDDGSWLLAPPGAATDAVLAA